MPGPRSPGEEGALRGCGEGWGPPSRGCEERAELRGLGGEGDTARAVREKGFSEAVRGGGSPLRSVRTDWGLLPDAVRKERRGLLG